jgi:hypothetical protein
VATSEQKTVPTNLDPDAVIAAVEDPVRRADLQALRAMFAEAAGKEPVMWGGSIIGFGAYAYRYESGHAGTSARIAFANRKGDMALYLMGRNEDREDLLARLGRHKTGKMCIYVRRLSDVDTGVLRELVDQSLEHMAQTYPDDPLDP